MNEALEVRARLVPVSPLLSVLSAQAAATVSGISLVAAANRTPMAALPPRRQSVARLLVKAPCGQVAWRRSQSGSRISPDHCLPTLPSPAASLMTEPHESAGLASESCRE
jgi:hypothetical protein